VDGLRGLAAVWVVINHICYTIWPETTPLERVPTFVQWFPSAHYGVTLFIVISGFCLMTPVVRNGGHMRDGTRSFFTRRIRRIIPPYYCTLALSVLLGLTILSHKTGTIWDKAIPVTWRDIWAHLLLVHNFASDPSGLNYPLWTIAVEWQTYLVFPLLLIIWRRFGPLVTTIVVSLITFFLAAVTRNTPLAGLKPHFHAFFCFGMLAATALVVETRWSLWLRRHVRLLLVVAGVLVLAIIVIPKCNFNPFLSYDDNFWSIPAAFAGLLLIVSLGWLPLARATQVLSSWPLAELGGFSYTLYLVHAPILQLIWQFLVVPLRLSAKYELALLCGPGIVLILFTSWLLYHLIERPFQSRKPVAPPHLSSVGTQQVGIPPASIIQTGS
jgi:peptidoglycan/LPS O-acetylase OafA/YrhL